MNIQFFGAVRTVTGAQFLIEANETRILLECGLYQGKRSESFEKNRNLPFDASKIDVCVLSHAHIDHSGNLPNLVKSGFRGDIVCTYATRDLCSLMLRDSASIQAADIEYINKQAAKKGKAPVEPIYTMEDTLACLRNFLGLAYDRPRTIAPGITLTLKDAGHILGSAIVILDIEDRKTGTANRLVFSGDLGRPNRPILCDPATVDHADILLIESTYGNREHEKTDEAIGKLKTIINETAKKGGKVLIPSFAVGRTQEIVYRLHALAEKNEIPRTLPVFIDSPLAIEATGIYRLHPEAFDEEANNMLLSSDFGDPFGYDSLRYTRSTSESKAINNLKGPAVIISASGMAEAGRILHHLKNGIEKSENTVLIVGWQAPDTLGKRLVDKEPVVKILGEELHLRARVEKISGFSAHADRNELLSWIGGFKRKPAKSFIVHGDESASVAFSNDMQNLGFSDVVVPKAGERYSV